MSIFCLNLLLETRPAVVDQSRLAAIRRSTDAVLRTLGRTEGIRPAVVDASFEPSATLAAATSSPPSSLLALLALRPHPHEEIRRTHWGTLSPPTVTLFDPPLVAFGVSARKQVTIPFAYFYSARPENISSPFFRSNRHTETVYRALTDYNETLLCPPGGWPAWLWVEDDVELCPGADIHLRALLEWISELPSASPLVYVRTSFGFNGLLVRCTRHGEFVKAVKKRRHLPAIDSGVAEIMNDGNHEAHVVATYRYNLFSHVSSSSMVHWAWDLDHRQEILTKCLEPNFNTMIAPEAYESRCLGPVFGPSMVSPCDLPHRILPPMRAGDYFPGGVYPIADTAIAVERRRAAEFFPKALLDGRVSVVAASHNFTCTERCALMHRRCEDDLMVALNAAVQADVPFDVPVVPDESSSILATVLLFVFPSLAPRTVTYPCARRTWLNGDYHGPKAAWMAAGYSYADENSTSCIALRWSRVFCDWNKWPYVDGKRLCACGRLETHPDLTWGGWLH